MDGLALILIADLMQDRDLRFHFNRNPERVMKLYRLPESAKQIVRTMRREEMAEQFALEIDRWGFPDDGFPSHEEGAPVLHYPNPDPELFDVKYRKNQTAFVIHGQSLKFKELKAGGGAGQAEILEVERALKNNTGTKNWVGFNLDSKKDVKGTFRSSKLIARFTSNPTPGDEYYIRVVINPGIASGHPRERLRIELEWPHPIEIK